MSYAEIQRLEEEARCLSDKVQELEQQLAKTNDLLGTYYANACYVSSQNAKLVEALRYMASHGCTMLEPCLSVGDRDDKCFACIAATTLKEVQGE